MSKQKRLCRTCFMNKSEFGPSPRKKPTTCEDCKTLGQLHRDSDWLWNMLVTRKPRKGKKKHKILWSKETLRDQLWWLFKPQKRVKQEVKQEIKVERGVVAGSLASSSASSSSSSSSSSSVYSAAAPRPQLEVLVKIEPGTEDENGEKQ
jgi:predicted AAA+ superfamily ATPase